VPRGVGFKLRAIKTDVTHLEHFHFRGHFQNLQKQVAQFVKEPSAESGQAVVIGMKVGGDEAEGYRGVACLLQPAAGKDTRGVAIDQNPQ
jgi:hypothetical protein